MTGPKNPFKATLGKTPPELVGRDEAISDFSSALEEGPGSHERVSLITGPRGIGKTVLLNAFEDQARERGWRVFSVTATPGFVTRLRDSFFRAISVERDTNRRRLSGLALSAFSVNWENAESHLPELTLRDVLGELLALQRELDRMTGQEPAGVLITVDELHYSNQAEVIELGETIQHLVREDEEIAVAMAGIPSAVKPLLADDDGRNPVTFLRRANRVELGPVRDEDVEWGLQKPVEDVGRRWERMALDLAVLACGGYPFMIQLVGHWVFRRSEGEEITVQAAELGIRKAQRALGQLVHEPALQDLSATDRTFLIVMAQDEGISKIADIASRMKVDKQDANVYRRRLIEAGMIRPVALGHIAFELPYMRDYLRDHAASDGFEAIRDL